MKKISLVILVFCFLATINCSFGQAVDQQSAAAQPNKIASQSLATDQVRSINYSLGEFIVESADEDTHYIKAEVVVMFEWVNDEPLKKNDSRLKESITAFFKQTTSQKAREDYIARTLHKDIQKVIEAELEKSSPDTFKIKTVVIPAFLIN